MERLTRMFITPFLCLAIWYHSWIGIGFVILWTIANPLRKTGSLMLFWIKTMAGKFHEEA